MFPLHVRHSPRTYLTPVAFIGKTTPLAQMEGESTAREGIYGLGKKNLRDDRLGARYKWGAGQNLAPTLD